MKDFTMPVSTRREFLGGGLAATAAMAVGAPAFAASAVSTPLYAAIYDERFTASRAFASEAARRGTRAKAIRGDVHDLWHDDLRHHWDNEPLALGGMTTHDALFLLTMMGREAGMRVIYRADHTLRSEGNEAGHVAFGPHDVLARHPDLRGPAALWGRTSARIVTSWPADGMAARRSRSTIDRAPSYAACHDALVSWLMVPASLRA